MKKFIILMLLTVLPLCIFSQEMGIDYHYRNYYDLSEKQLNTRLFWNNAATAGSVVLTAMGVAAIGIGSYYGVYCGALSIMSIANGGLSDPLGAFSTYFLGATSVGGFGLALLGYGMIKLSIDAIQDLSHNKHLIKVELKQFRPTSYKDAPGIGGGITIDLNLHYE